MKCGNGKRFSAPYIMKAISFASSECAQDFGNTEACCFSDWGNIGIILSSIVPHQRSTFFITESSKIGNGLVLQHGYSSILFPESMGNNCQVWHNVTIGRAHDKGPRPIIGDNVKICAGSFVLGGIKVGNNVTVGAGTLLVKDVPDNCVVCGNPAYIIKQNGKKVHVKL